jgi:hypothetical protein
MVAEVDRSHQSLTLKENTDKRNKAGNRALDPASSPEFGHLGLLGHFVDAREAGL